MSTSESVDNVIHGMKKMCRTLGKGDVDFILRIILSGAPETEPYLLDKNPQTMDELEKYAMRAEQTVNFSKKERADVVAIKMAISPLVDRMESLAEMQYAGTTEQGSGSSRDPPQCTLCFQCGHSGSLGSHTVNSVDY